MFCRRTGRHWADLPTKNDFDIIYFDTLTVSMACNSRAELGKDLPNNRTEIIGNKTEGAMLTFLRVLGVDYRELRTKTDVVPPPLKDLPLERFSMFRVRLVLVFALGGSSVSAWKAWYGRKCFQ